MRQWLRKKNSVASCVLDVGASSQTIRGEGGHASSQQRTHLGDLASGDSPYVGIDDLLHVGRVITQERQHREPHPRIAHQRSAW